MFHTLLETLHFRLTFSPVVMLEVAFLQSEVSGGATRIFKQLLVKVFVALCRRSRVPTLRHYAIY